MIVAFIGPSVPRRRLSEFKGIEFRRSARRGDLRAAVLEGFRTVVLIDGVMVYSYPPSPQEVAFALVRGVQVHGAASLGALRAVELRSMGMIGSGWVYQQFLDEQVDRDDELLASFDEDTGEVSTVPLIDVRYACGMAVKVGAMSLPQAEMLIGRLGCLYFENRTATCIREMARDLNVGGVAIDWICGPRRLSIKRRDAMTCLRRVADTSERQPYDRV